MTTLVACCSRPPLPSCGVIRCPHCCSQFCHCCPPTPATPCPLAHACHCPHAPITLPPQQRNGTPAASIIPHCHRCPAATPPTLQHTCCPPLTPSTPPCKCCATVTPSMPRHTHQLLSVLVCHPLPIATKHALRVSNSQRITLRLRV
jgi:hypothetical protein